MSSGAPPRLLEPDSEAHIDRDAASNAMKPLVVTRATAEVPESAVKTLLCFQGCDPPTVPIPSLSEVFDLLDFCSDVTSCR